MISTCASSPRNLCLLQRGKVDWPGPATLVFGRADELVRPYPWWRRSWHGPNRPHVDAAGLWTCQPHTQVWRPGRMGVEQGEDGAAKRVSSLNFSENRDVSSCVVTWTNSTRANDLKLVLGLFRFVAIPGWASFKLQPRVAVCVDQWCTTFSPLPVALHLFQSRRNRGASVGLASPNKAPIPPNWNMKHCKSVEVWSTFKMSNPLYKWKASLLKTFNSSGLFLWISSRYFYFSIASVLFPHTEPTLLPHVCLAVLPLSISSYADDGECKAAITNMLNYMFTLVRAQVLHAWCR